MAGQNRKRKSQAISQTGAPRFSVPVVVGSPQSTAPRHVAIAGLILIAATTLAYLNSFNGAFVFDDDGHIVKNFTIRHLWPPSWLHPTPRPFVDLTLAINYAIGRLDPWGYHLVNLATHLLAALTLFAIVRRTLLSPAVPPAYGRGARSKRGTASEALSADSRPDWIAHETLIALFIALIWALHPLQTQSITFVIQRAESMMGLFFLLTLYCFIRGASGSSYWVFWYIGSIIACVLGMASKAVIVVVPFVLFLYDYAFISQSLIEVIRRRWLFYIAITFTVLWMLVATGLTTSVLSSKPGFFVSVGFGVEAHTWKQYLASQPGVILHYLRLCFWPYPQCIDYEWPVVSAAKDVAVPSLLLVPMILLTIVALVRWPAWGFLGAWFFGILAPSSSFIPVQDLAMEHRMYLSLAAVAAFVVISLDLLMRRLPVRKRVAQQIGLVALIAIALGWRTFERNKVYASSVALWGDVVKQFPANSRAWNNYGEALSGANRLSEAAEAYARSIQLNAWLPDSHFNLGKTYYQLQNFPAAEREYREAIRLAPQNLQSYIMLGNLYFDLKRTGEAESMFRAAIKAAPPDAERELLAKAHYNLGNSLARRGAINEALQSYINATTVDPDYASGYHGQGWAWETMNNFPKAIEFYRKALEVDPKHAAARKAHDDLMKRIGAAKPAVPEG